MESKLKKITYLILSLLIALLLNNTLIFNNGAQTELSIPKQSAGDIDPIHIDGNWSDTRDAYYWCYGDGSWSTPYIIENVSIDASISPTGSGIFINNSLDVYFIIKNCSIINAYGIISDYGAGIELQNCSRGLIFNNTCTDSDTYGCGILLEDYNCYNITIERNVVKSIGQDGILSFGGNETSIINNTVSDCYEKGIHLYNGCENFTVAHNYVEDVGHSGIDAGVCLLFFNHNNTIYNNTIINSWRGIYLENSRDNSIFNNTVKNNEEAGIELRTNSNYNNVTDNIASNDNEGYDQDYGIWLSSSDYNNIINNTANDNNNYGITIEASNNNTISGNRIFNNKDTGIHLDEVCEYNVITENIIYNNSRGIYLYSDCSNNSIYKNFFLENGKHAEDYGTDNKWNSTSIGNYWDNWTTPDVSPNDGIVDLPYNISGSAGSKDFLPIAEDGAPSITINSPTSSDVFGVTAPSFDVTITDDYLDSMWYTIDGGINNYTFIENGIINQTAWTALTEGSVTITFYASDIIRNIGIDEVSVVKDTTAPIIVIHSPTDGDVFGNNAPLFNITVTENNLDLMWYSFDGGVSTYAITNNTVFNQTAWTALTEGDVTITFYARDLAGNEASEAGTGVTRISAAGLEPGIIITIVVVSIVGGVAVAAVIYIYIKKRASPK